MTDGLAAALGCARLRQVVDAVRAEVARLDSGSGGPLALARLLSRPETLHKVTGRLVAGGEPEPPEAPGFKIDGAAVRRVVSDLAADPTAGRLLNGAASRYASWQLSEAAGPFLADRDADAAQGPLQEIGALFGALASRSYDPGVAVDVADVGANAAKAILEKLAGAATGPTGGVDPLVDGFDSVDEWREQLFKDGQLAVPDPNIDGLAWDAFLAWARHVNPGLAAAARLMHSTMTAGFNSQVLHSQ